MRFMCADAERETALDKKDPGAGPPAGSGDQCAFGAQNLLADDRARTARGFLLDEPRSPRSESHRGRAPSFALVIGSGEKS